MPVNSKKRKPIRLLRRNLFLSRMYSPSHGHRARIAWRPHSGHNNAASANRRSMTSLFEPTGRLQRSELAINTGLIEILSVRGNLTHNPSERDKGCVCDASAV